MERPHRPPSTSTPKMERRIIEKNRRNHMKNLYSQLYSLLPSYGTKEVLPTVPDQIDEARMYIESLQKKLEMYNEEKMKLLYGKRPLPSTRSTESPKSSSTSKFTDVEVHDLGPNMDVVFISGLQEQALFYRIIRLLCDEGFEVVSADFSATGNSTLHIGYEKLGGKPMNSRGDSSGVSKRLKEVICGYSDQFSHGGHEVESRLDLWDYEIEPAEILSSPQLGPFVPVEEYHCFLQQL